MIFLSSYQTYDLINEANAIQDQGGFVIFYILRNTTNHLESEQQTFATLLMVGCVMNDGTKDAWDRWKMDRILGMVICKKSP